MPMPTAPCLIQRAYKFAVAPNPGEAAAFASHAGGARYAFNLGLQWIIAALDARRAQEESGIKPDIKVPGHFDLCKAWTAYKDDPANGLDWVGENSTGTYQAAMRDAATARANYDASRHGRRKGRAVGRPRFKSKHRTPPSFQLHGDSLRMINGTHIQLPKIGTVKIPGKVRVGTWTDRNARKARSLLRALRKANATGITQCPTCHGTGEVTVRTKGNPTKPAEPRTVKCGKYGPYVDPEDKRPGCLGHGKVEPARIVRATISRGASGTWWCSVTVQLIIQVPVTPTKRQTRNGTVGVDLGVRHLAVTSTGDTYTNSQFLATHLDELRRLQKAVSRAEKESKRREKARRRLGTLHEQVALMRKDATDRISTELARAFALIGVEGWDAQRLAAKRTEGVPLRLRKARHRALADAAPGMLRWQLAYKASWNGTTLHKGAPHWETGRTCSVCDRVRTKPVPLTEEMFRCDSGHTLARRVNSARVMAKIAAGLIAPIGTMDEPRGGDVRPVTPRRTRRSPVKRARPSRSPDRTGTPDP